MWILPLDAYNDKVAGVQHMGAVSGGMQAKEALVASYRQLRAGDATGGAVYRITVRQLEALVRLSEAHARIRCSPVIEPRDVREVSRLFACQTMQPFIAQVMHTLACLTIVCRLGG